MKNMKYIVLSMENWCVFTYTQSHHIANAICEGVGDAVAVGMSRASNKWFKKIVNRNMFYEKIIMLDNKNRTMKEMPNETVSASWRETQDLIRMRQRAFFAWETATWAALSKIDRNHWDYFDTVAVQEIANSDPDNNYYTPILEEYARTVEQPVEHAYKNLKMRIEANNAAKFRIQSLSEKWKNKINESYTREELVATNQGMQRDFWLNSRI